mmetsp:Transcript_17671/g.53815  ORF Transcript_17671/g.53815 Transcript_17671/m.53815 type:complete len:267 (+) Transcript_17671:503-1303(+)
MRARVREGVQLGVQLGPLRAHSRRGRGGRRDGRRRHRGGPQKPPGKLRSHGQGQAPGGICCKNRENNAGPSSADEPVQTPPETLPEKRRHVPGSRPVRGGLERTVAEGVRARDGAGSSLAVRDRRDPRALQLLRLALRLWLVETPFRRFRAKGVQGAGLQGGGKDLRHETAVQFKERRRSIPRVGAKRRGARRGAGALSPVLLPGSERRLLGKHGRPLRDASGVPLGVRGAGRTRGLERARGGERRRKGQLVAPRAVRNLLRRPPR